MFNLVSNYYYIFVFVIVSLFFSIIFFFFSYFVIFKSRDLEKQSSYECGFVPFELEGRNKFDIKFYLVGILFIIFDLEIIFFFPWVVSLTFIDYVGYFTMIVFVALLSFSFIFEWKMGVLEWGATSAVVDTPPTFSFEAIETIRAYEDDLVLFRQELSELFLNWFYMCKLYPK